MRLQVKKPACDYANEEADKLYQFRIMGLGSDQEWLQTIRSMEAKLDKREIRQIQGE